MQFLSCSVPRVDQLDRRARELLGIPRCAHGIVYQADRCNLSISGTDRQTCDLAFEEDIPIPLCGGSIEGKD
ncbi:hypothetical protein [Arthrobacter echini]|uniref:hypothetical protein n=1 Tax=Arthrobacter echini TaxID=1529066 RepID=UPI0021CD1208|nr:hypothetical protein [Arthrobacter echini]